MDGVDDAGAPPPPDQDVEHVHVEAAVVDGVVASQAVLTPLLGRAPATPAAVLTGCGLRRPLGATSPLPERVTCWTCRQHAAGVHQRTAEQWRALAEMLGHSPAVEATVLTAHRDRAASHDDLAARYRR